MHTRYNCDKKAFMLCVIYIYCPDILEVCFQNMLDRYLIDNTKQPLNI